jgi:hypothetical protein
VAAARAFGEVGAKVPGAKGVDIAQALRAAPVARQEGEEPAKILSVAGKRMGRQSAFVGQPNLPALDGRAQVAADRKTLL